MWENEFATGIVDAANLGHDWTGLVICSSLFLVHYFFLAAVSVVGLFFKCGQ
jgi:hypothetical protein